MVLIRTLSHYFVKIPMNMLLSGGLFVFCVYVWTHAQILWWRVALVIFVLSSSCDSTLLHHHVPLSHASNFQPTPFSVSESGEGPRKRSVRHSHETKRRKLWWLIRAPWLQENSSSFRYSLSSFSPKHIKSVRIKAFLVFVLLLFCYFPAFPNSFCVFLNYVSLKQCLCEAAWLVSLFLLIIIHIAAVSLWTLLFLNKQNRTSQLSRNDSRQSWLTVNGGELTLQCGHCVHQYIIC